MKFIKLSTSSLLQIIPNKTLNKNEKNINKFCRNCKYFIPENDLFYIYNGNGDKDNRNTEFSKCKLFPIVNNSTKYQFLVSGEIRHNFISYDYCSKARENDNMCGENGKNYSEK